MSAALQVATMPSPVEPPSPPSSAATPGTDEPSVAALTEMAAAALASGVIERSARLWRPPSPAVDQDLPALDAFHLYLADVRRKPGPLPRASQRDAAASGRTDLLIESSLTLVIALALDVAAGYVHQGQQMLMDLISEGNLGLIRAAQRFDWRRGFAFSTYAVWWIQRALWDEAARQALPNNLLNEQGMEWLRVLRHARRDLERDNPGQLYTLPEVAAVLSTRHVPLPETLARARRHARWPTPLEVAELLAAMRPLSLDTPLDAGDPSSGARTPTTLAALLVAPSPPTTTADTRTAALWRALAEALAQTVARAQLSTSEAQWCALRLGLPLPAGLDWHPPPDWRAGSVLPLRPLAQAVGLSYSELQRRLRALTVRLMSTATELGADDARSVTLIARALAAAAHARRRRRTI